MGLSGGLTAAPRAQLGGRSRPGAEGLGKLPAGGASLTILHHSRLRLLRWGQPGLRSLRGPAQHPESPALAQPAQTWSVAAAGSRAAVWDPAWTLRRETPSQLPASSSSPLVSFPGQLLSLAPANAAPGEKETETGVEKAPSTPRPGGGPVQLSPPCTLPVPLPRDRPAGPTPGTASTQTPPRAAPGPLPSHPPAGPPRS